MDLIEVGDWVAGGIVIVGLIQWLKGMVPKGVTIPSWVWGISAAILACGWSVAPPWAKQAAGVLAVSQIGYETIIQSVKTALKKRLGTEATS